MKIYRVRPEIERFWEKVDKSSGQGPYGDCWTWKASTRHGYGQFTVVVEPGRYRTVKANRYAFEATFGPLLFGECALHSCDNPPCVRPSHLWRGSDADNMHDRDAKGRAAVGERNGRPRTKLTSIMVVEIRELLAVGGIAQREIAGRYSVSQAAISEIACGRSWAWFRELGRIE